MAKKKSSKVDKARRANAKMRTTTDQALGRQNRKGKKNPLDPPRPNR